MAPRISMGQFALQIMQDYSVASNWPVSIPEALRRKHRNFVQLPVSEEYLMRDDFLARIAAAPAKKSHRGRSQKWPITLSRCFANLFKVGCIALLVLGHFCSSPPSDFLAGTAGAKMIGWIEYLVSYTLIAR